MLILTGAAACGKDTAAKGLLKEYNPSSLIVTFTTRPPRTGEVDGKDYFFTNEPNFQKMLQEGKFLESVAFAGYSYGTPKGEIEKVFSCELVVWIIEPTTAARVPQLIKSAFDPETAGKLLERILVVFLDAPLQERYERLLERQNKGVDGQSIRKRIEQDEIDLSKTKGKFANIAVNRHGQLSRTIAEVSELIEQKIG